jgi:hypothetical protein
MGVFAHILLYIVCAILYHQCDLIVSGFPDLNFQTACAGAMTLFQG